EVWRCGPSNLSDFDKSVLRRPLSFLTAAVVMTYAVMAAAPLSAQLRPLEPVEWDAFGRGNVVMHIGAGVHSDMRAGLAGTTGRLVELGNFTAAWRTGRVVLEGFGTLQRRFTDQGVWAPPVEYTRAPNGQTRVDAGLY